MISRDDLEHILNTSLLTKRQREELTVRGANPIGLSRLTDAAIRTIIAPNGPQGLEKVQSLQKELDRITEEIIGVTEGVVDGFIFFGSRLDPLKAPRDDADTDFAVITRGYVEDTRRRLDLQSKILQIFEEKKQKGDCHLIMPDTNIPFINRRVNTWGSLGIGLNLDNTYITGLPNVVTPLKQTLIDYLQNARK